MENIKIGDVIIYKQIKRVVKSIDMIENLIGLEPILEPENIIWVRFENCIL